MVDSLVMKVKLFISARKLKNLDLLSKSDPLCKIHEWVGNKWVLIGTTESIKNNLNPDWTTGVEIDFYFEKMQKIKFEVLDHDVSNADDLIGTYETNVAAIMGANA